jgi:hypothetical protein
MAGKLPEGTILVIEGGILHLAHELFNQRAQEPVVGLIIDRGLDSLAIDALTYLHVMHDIGAVEIVDTRDPGPKVDMLALVQDFASKALKQPVEPIRTKTPLSRGERRQKARTQRMAAAQSFHRR